MLKKQIKYSVVIPLKNEEGNISDLIEELEPIMNSFEKSWEAICIDDGSTDRTLDILCQLARNKNYLRILVFTKNFGQSSAFDAGFRSAKGEFVITLDGDRQNDPNDIPKLLELAKTHDLVCGYRQRRKDTLTKKMISFFANRIRSWACQDGMKDTGCSLKVYRTASLAKIKMYHGMHRFLPALFMIEGFQVAQIPVNHRERKVGKTKYNLFNRSFNTISDMLAVRWMRKRQLKYQIKKELP
jgi:dolichol-phosphate mannosyltransferase